MYIPTVEDVRLSPLYVLFTSGYDDLVDKDMGGEGVGGRGCKRVIVAVQICIILHVLKI